ncbi:hypothetical protein RHGRI_026742 [Rhododendron griersonianum]|uniref:Uncharacterized protein n=1 Tax=Rhododendron griersonianum TaxID=479676 RepID=A0AAV6ITR5_9ERIC|nr:hypothetical protein RHGRI_026742 [Rhododendron griersonianum]
MVSIQPKWCFETTFVITDSSTSFHVLASNSPRPPDGSSCLRFCTSETPFHVALGLGNLHAYSSFKTMLYSTVYLQNSINYFMCNI